MSNTMPMYDAVTASKIPNPHLVRAVLVYIDGHYKWSSEDIDLFPNASKIRIATSPSTLDGRVLDVENGDATPKDAPKWVLNRRSHKKTVLIGAATIYCSAAYWPTVRNEFHKQNVAEPEYLIAQWDNKAVIPPGAIGKQYLNTPGFDLSVVETSWL